MQPSTMSKLARQAVESALPALAGDPSDDRAARTFEVLRTAMAAKPGAAEALAALGAAPPGASKQRAAVHRELETIMLCDQAFAATLAGALMAREGHFVLPMQQITLAELDSPGPVLDIGGGGEGIIGCLMQPRTVAIDRSRAELMDAPAGPAKIVADAANLVFADGSFATATAFYSCMYFAPQARAGVLSEVWRILAPGGVFHVWDATIPRRGEREERVFVVPLVVTLPAGEVLTGYGVPWESRAQDLPLYVQAAARAGFEVIAQREEGQSFYLQLRKPSPTE